MKIRIKRGLDLKIPGAPAQVLDAGGSVRTAALVGPDYERLAPALSVEQDAEVRRGETLFTDRGDPAVRYTAPVSGRVLAIHRGARRRLLSVVIEIDDRIDALHFPAHARDELQSLPAETVRARLLESGLWTAFRSRPLERVPRSSAAPAAIFVTAVDTNPHAVDPSIVIAPRADAFTAGVAVITRLGAPTFVCARAAAMPPLAGADAEVVEFVGPHPAGLVGTHMLRLAPASAGREVWHIGYQDVVAIGELFVTGRLDTCRVVALGGPAVRRPRLLQTNLGASLDDLIAGEVEAGARIVSGSLLSGRAVTAETAYLGRYATQVSAIADPRDSTGVSSTALNGYGSGMLAVESLERVWPHRTPVLPLLRALLVGDVETAESLGALSLAEEDLALCAYLCPAKLDYAAALRSMLEAFGEAVAP